MVCEGMTVKVTNVSTIAMKMVLTPLFRLFSEKLHDIPDMNMSEPDMQSRIVESHTEYRYGISCPRISFKSYIKW